MDRNEITQKVEKILETFGMIGKVASHAMGVTEQTFRNKKNPNLSSHSFNQKNLDDLVAYIKQEAEKL